MSGLCAFRSERRGICTVVFSGVAKFVNYRISYCVQRDHHRMVNRDVAAAQKIGVRSLATKKKDLNLGPPCRGSDLLGPWSRDVSAEEVERGTRASTVLREVLTSYARGGKFSETFSETFSDTSSETSPRPMKAEYSLFEVPSTSLSTRAITTYEQYKK